MSSAWLFCNKALKWAGPGDHVT